MVRLGWWVLHFVYTFCVLFVEKNTVYLEMNHRPLPNQSFTAAAALRLQTHVRKKAKNVQC